MRFFSLLFLLAFAGVAGAFAWQNQQEVTVQFLDWSMSANMALIIGGAFAAGMLSGWSIIGLLRRSVHRTAELFNRPHVHAGV